MAKTKILFECEEEFKARVVKQAKELDLSVSAYIRLLVNKDSKK